MSEPEGFSHQYATINGLRYHYVREPAPRRGPVWARPGGNGPPLFLIHGWPGFYKFPIAWSDRLPDFFPNLTLRTVPQCGHWVQREQPELVNQAVAEFIAP